MKENSLKPLKWDDVNGKMIQPYPYANYKKKFNVLEEMNFKPHMSNIIERTLREDGLTNLMPSGSEKKIADVIFRYAFLMGDATKDPEFVKSGHIIIKPDGEFGFCKESPSTGDLECYQRGYMTHQLYLAKASSPNITETEIQLTDLVLKKITENPLSATSRILFSIICWLWFHDTIYTNKYVKFTVDGSWMRIDITDGKYKMDVEDLTLKQDLPKNLKSILTTFSPTFCL